MVPQQICFLIFGKPNVNTFNCLGPKFHLKLLGNVCIVSRSDNSLLALAIFHALLSSAPLLSQSALSSQLSLHLSFPSPPTSPPLTPMSPSTPPTLTSSAPT